MGSLTGDTIGSLLQKPSKPINLALEWWFDPLPTIENDEIEVKWEEAVESQRKEYRDVFWESRDETINCVVFERSDEYETTVANMCATHDGFRLGLSEDYYEAVDPSILDTFLSIIARHELCHVEAFCRNLEWYEEDSDDMERLWYMARAPKTVCVEQEKAHYPFYGWSDIDEVPP